MTTQAERIEEALKQAAERRAAMTPEQHEKLDAMLAAFNSRFVRMFAGPEGERKGYCPVWTCPVEEFREFRKLHPATHRWAAWEESLDL